MTQESLTVIKCEAIRVAKGWRHQIAIRAAQPTFAVKCARIVATFILMQGLFQHRVDAQELLDTGRTAFGTRLVRNIAPGPNDTWELNRIRDAEVDRLGQIWVLEDTDMKVRVFSAEGRLLHTLGGVGSGPGEFQGFRFVQALGDTMWVYDPRSPRFTPYSITTGKLLKSSRAGAANQSVYALSPVGSFVRSFSDPNGGATETKPVVITFRHDPLSRSQSRKLAELIQRQPLYSARIYNADKAPPPPAPKQNGSGLKVLQLFENSILFGVGSGGRSLLLIDRAVAGAASANPMTWSKPTTLFRIIEIGLNGDTISTHQYATPTAPLTKAHVEAVIDSFSHAAAVASNRNWRASASDIRQALYVPRTWPAVMDIHVGIDGCLWLLQPQPPSRVAKYWRISADGKILPAVWLNSGLRILRVAANRLWLVKEDGDGLPTIQIHEIVPLKQ